MNIERFKIRKEKNENSGYRAFAGGRVCEECGEYSSGGSFVAGIDENGVYSEKMTYSKPTINNGVCEYCIEDLN
jgi:hypothetical protein